MIIIELNQLEYFKKLAQIQHFTLAAQKIAISQSALSRSIANLEKELGVPLFDRIGKSIVLTQYGQTFLKYADRALNELAEGRQAVSELTAPTKGTINISFLHSLSTYLVPKLLSKFRQQYPDIQFVLDQKNLALLKKQLLASENDLCFCSELLDDDHLEWLPLCSEELFVVVPANHPLAARQSIHLSEIANEPLITFKPYFGLRIQSDRLFEALSIHPRVTFEGDEIITLASLVDANLGIALIPHMPGLEHLNIAFLPVSYPVCQRRLGIARNKHHFLSPAALKFQQFVLDAFKNDTDFSDSPYYHKI